MMAIESHTKQRREQGFRAPGLTAYGQACDYVDNCDDAEMFTSSCAMLGPKAKIKPLGAET